MRRGVELGGWWPFVLALFDAWLAFLNSGVVATGIVIGIQAFDELARGVGVMSLPQLFQRIAVDPTAPEHWWIYALPLTTMIPSLINLMAAAMSLMSPLRARPSLILKFMPAGKAVPAFDRAWIATILALQIVGGALLGITVQMFVAIAVLVYVMPWLGLELLDMARAVAAFDLPGKLLAGW
jgi:hypothetical protein